MDIGHAWVFLRRDGAPLPPGCAGHVGWGLRLADGTHLFGSTENGRGLPHVRRGGDNGAWLLRGPFDQGMAAMRTRNYDAWKHATFRKPDPTRADAFARTIAGRGYDAIGNNCLDHACAVLGAYGQPDLPWALTHPSPNDWFGVYNGEFHNMAER